MKTRGRFAENVLIRWAMLVCLVSAQ